MPDPSDETGHGGKRAGAGRKRSALPQEVVDRVGPPPTDSPLKMARWWSRLLAEVGWLLIQGKAPATLVRDVRALVATGAKIVPDDVKAEVDRLLRLLDEGAKPEDTGPKLEEHRGDQPSLRGAPR